MTQVKASLILSTFNMPKHLELVLVALSRQSDHNFELLICDDGSSSETSELIQMMKPQLGVDTQHIWQEHQGFRKCRILNEGIRKASGDVFIFLDGDCVPHRDFVLDHVRQQETGFYLAGRRVELSESLSAALTPQDVRAGFFDGPSFRLWKSCRSGESQNFQRSIRIPFEPIRTLLRMDRIDDLKGCNFSVSRKDLYAINGFDEEYEGYGREDTDLEIRLQNLGLRIKSLKGLALQFHVWHPRREFTPANDHRLEDLKRSGRFRCERGIIK